MLQFRGVAESADAVYILTEVCAGGTLAEYLHAHGALSEAQAAAAMRAVLSAIAACHAAGIEYGVSPACVPQLRGPPSAASPHTLGLIGRERLQLLLRLRRLRPGPTPPARPRAPLPQDLKPTNVLLRRPTGPGEPLDLALADFGCSQYVGPCGRAQQSPGTPLFAAPEVMVKANGLEADMWSAGVLVSRAGVLVRRAGAARVASAPSSGAGGAGAGREAHACVCFVLQRGLITRGSAAGEWAERRAAPRAACARRCTTCSPASGPSTQSRRSCRPTR